MRAKRLLAVVAGTGDDDHESSVKVGVRYSWSTTEYIIRPVLAQLENNRKTTAASLH